MGELPGPAPIDKIENNILKNQLTRPPIIICGKPSELATMVRVPGHDDKNIRLVIPLSTRDEFGPPVAPNNRSSSDVKGKDVQAFTIQFKTSHGHWQGVGCKKINKDVSKTVTITITDSNFDKWTCAPATHAAPATDSQGLFCHQEKMRYHPWPIHIQMSCIIQPPCRSPGKKKTYI